jgi:hypothetical protein
MPIITKPSSIEKGTSASFSLDKSALAAVASVAADSYYSQSSNWKEVFLYYKSSTGNQRKMLKFNAELSSPTANFLASEKARDIFQVQKIVIMDFDGGSILIPRSQLTVAEFDVDMGGPAPVVSLDFTQGVLPAGTSVVSGTEPIMTNASAKFDSYGAQINMPIAYTYTAFAQYKVRLYIKAVAEAPGTTVIAQFNSLFRATTSPIMEVPPFSYGPYNAELDLSAKVGSYIEYIFTSGVQFNDGFPVMLAVQVSPSGSIGSYLEITKIEIFEN